MQGATPIFATDQIAAASTRYFLLGPTDWRPKHTWRWRKRSLYLVVGSTPGIQEHEFLEFLRNMGGDVLPPAETQQWHNHLHTDGFDALPTGERQESTRGPAILPLTITAEENFLPSLISRLGNARLLLLYTPPELLLWEAIANETSALEALDNWCNASQALLGVVKQNRRRTTLVNVESAFRFTSEFKALCQQRFALEIPNKETQLSPRLHEPLSEVHRLIASHIVGQSPHAQHLLRQLETIAEPLNAPSSTTAVDWEAALAEWRDTNALEELKEENQLILLQLHQIQEELQNYSVRVRETQKKLSDMEKQREETKNKLEKNLKKLSESEKKLADVRKELANAQERLAHSESTVANQKTKLRRRLRKYYAERTKAKRLKSDLAETIRTLTAIRNSKSWKLTKPLRDVRAMFLRRRATQTRVNS